MTNWNWVLTGEILYIIIVALVCLRVIFDTRSSTKTLGYLLMIIFLPVAGMFIYFSFGINYRKNKIYTKKLIHDEKLETAIGKRIREHSEKIFENATSPIKGYSKVFRFLLNESRSGLTDKNQVELLINGEEKFPKVIEALEKAKHHIHLEYYIFEDDIIGNTIIDLLLKKVQEGVEVRFIYDAFGSNSIRRKLVKRAKAGGIKAFPFYKIIFVALANRLNYRNHRKIIVIDGTTGFVGGINISDKYINSSGSGNTLFWRDTHLMLQGPAVYYLQYLFITDWNFCANDRVQPGRHFFPELNSASSYGDKLVQTVASGPDSDNPSILFAMLQIISAAKYELLITTPYFIPGESIMEALIVAAYSGVNVKLLVPGISDSFFVNSAANSYYGELLKAGIEIYRYKKGFVHAKTLVCDRNLLMVGTANMDLRSFDLNFEVNAIVYDEQIAGQLALNFENDILDAERAYSFTWNNRPLYTRLMEKTCRLLSPLL